MVDFKQKLENFKQIRGKSRFYRGLFIFNFWGQAKILLVKYKILVISVKNRENGIKYRKLG